MNGYTDDTGATTTTTVQTQPAHDRGFGHWIRHNRGWVIFGLIIIAIIIWWFWRKRKHSKGTGTTTTTTYGNNSGTSGTNRSVNVTKSRGLY